MDELTLDACLYYKLIFEPKAQARRANNNLRFKTDIIDEFNIQISNKTGFQVQVQFLFEPRCEKNGLRGFRPGPTQTGLYSHKRRLEA